MCIQMDWLGWLGFLLVAGQSVYTDGLVGLGWLSSSSRSECVYRWIGWLGFVLVAGQSVYTDGLVGLAFF